MIDDNDFQVKKCGIVTNIYSNKSYDNETVVKKYENTTSKSISPVSIAVLINDSDWTPSKEDQYRLEKIINQIHIKDSFLKNEYFLENLTEEERLLIVKKMYYEKKRNQSFMLFKSDFRSFLNCEEINETNLRQYNRITDYLIEIKKDN